MTAETTLQSFEDNEPLADEAQASEPIADAADVTPTAVEIKSEPAFVASSFTKKEAKTYRPLPKTADITTPVVKEVVEPIDEPPYSLEQQIADNRKQQDILADKLIVEVYAATRIALTKDDPLIQWFIGSKNMLTDVAELVADNVLKSVVQEIEASRQLSVQERKQLNEAFDARLKEMKELLEAVKEQKQSLLAELNVRMDKRIEGHFTNIINKNFEKIAANANSKVNNDRIKNEALLKGGAIGLGVGVVVGIVFLILMLVLK